MVRDERWPTWIATPCSGAARSWRCPWRSCSLRLRLPPTGPHPSSTAIRPPAALATGTWPPGRPNTTQLSGDRRDGSLVATTTHTQLRLRLGVSCAEPVSLLTTNGTTSRQNRACPTPRLVQGRPNAICAGKQAALLDGASAGARPTRRATPGHRQPGAAASHHRAAGAA